MVEKVKKYFWLLFTFFFVQAQVILQKEEFIGNKYRLTYVNQEGQASSFIDSNNGDGDRNRSRELFIALPVNSHPKINFIPLRQKPITETSVDLSNQLSRSYYSIKGYLWVEDQYCVHISINPLYSNNGRMQELQEFRIEFELGNQKISHASTQQLQRANNIIDNPIYGSAWRSAQPIANLPQTDSWINYNNDYVKLGVATDGIKRIRYNDLVSYGVPVNSLNPKTLKIFLKGKEIPIYVSGENDNVFNQQDYIEFLGRRNYGDVRYREIAPYDTPYYEYLNLYSDTTIYWLTWDGATGKRIDTITVINGNPTSTIRHFDKLAHSEANQFWDFSINGGDLRKNYPEITENETWNDGGFGVGKLSLIFTATDLFPNKPAHAFIKLQDFASTVTTNAHNLALAVNNTVPKFDSGFIDKYQGKVLKANFSSAILKAGSNTIDLHSFAVPGNAINTVIRDWYEFEYPRYLKTSTDSLNFAYTNLTAPEYASVVITGLTSGNFSLHKFILDDSSVTKITNFTILGDTLRFVDSVKNGAYYFLLRENKIPSPYYYYKKKFVNLRTPSRQADYIAITHPTFLPQAASYASFISSAYGVSSTVINVHDIYDEFNYGFFAPEPIKYFLMMTHQNWQLPKPKYVFLIGKGTYDFYGYKAKYFGAPKTTNYVPSFGNPVSDNWYVLWDTTGSLIPQMNIGRIPVKTVDEFQAYYLKHQKYVSKGFDEWNKRFLFFSGGNFSDPNQIAQAKGINDFIINNYVSTSPIGGNVKNFFKTANPVTNFGPYSPEYFKDAIDQGGVFISYIGHSGTQTWDNSITDISQLSNIRDRNPMISDFGCSTAKFAEPDVVSFSELAVNSLQGQAISYIGNSSLGFTSTAYTFPQIFYKKLLKDTSASLGDVHRLAKIDYIKQYGTSGSYGLFIKTNTLIGDPIVSLQIPTKPNFSLASSIVQVSPEQPTDQLDSVTIALTYYNYGAVIGDSVTISIKSEYHGAVQYAATIKKSIPLYSDSLRLSLPINSFAGEHTVTIRLDSANVIDELYETDNVLVKTILVAATTIRNLSISQITNQTDGTITYINPTIQSPKQNFFVDVSEEPSFAQKQTYQIPYDTFFTSVKLNTVYNGKRIWVRSKYDEISGNGLPFSYRVGNKSNFLLDDSSSFSTLHLTTAKNIDGTLKLDSTRSTFGVISGGFNDGVTAVITKNGQNFIPENTKRGHHVVLFHSKTLQQIGYYYFDVFSSAAIATNYKNFLDTLNNQHIVAIGISDEGFQNLSVALKTSIKSFGSRYIDSLKFRGSWAMIGRKGAAIGSVPEKFSNPFQGRVQIDTTIIAPDTVGIIETPNFGPVAAWNSIETKYSMPNGSNIKLGLLGVKNDNTVDTLQQLLPIDTLINISSINATQYPHIKLFGEVNAGAGKVSPSLSSLAINYKMLPELGTNYQVFKGFHLQNNIPSQEIAATDTIVQGEKVQFTYRVYNVGGTTAKNIPVKLTSTWSNNYIEQIAVQTIDSIAPESYKEIMSQYNTSLGNGKRTIQLSIDPDTTIKEIYKDNNFYSYPLVIKKASGNPILPNLSITQNAVTSIPQQITDDVDTAKFLIAYSNSGSIVNDSISIQIKHFYQGNLLASEIVRRKYPVANDTILLKIPILKNAGEHQLSIDLDYNGLIVESSESDNLSNYYFTVATTDFKILHPQQNSISAVNQAVFLNPTFNSGGSSTVNFELDTLPNFINAQKISQSLQQFTSIFPLPDLKKSKRYYWRIKIVNSGHDWTTGSFYSGDSSSTLFGQLDSVSWKENAFLRTAYSLDSGARIVDTKITIKALSAGLNDGNTGLVEINGVNVIGQNFGIGHNVVVLDTTAFDVVSQKRFTIAANADESDSLTQFISAIPNGKIVIDVIVEDGVNNLKQTTRDALKTLGSQFIDQVSFRDSWSIIGRKGAAIGSVPETYKPLGTGNALTETTLVRIEKSGTIVTPILGPFTSLSTLVLDDVIPVGSQLKVQFVGISQTNSSDTLITVVNQNSIPLNTINTKQYRYGKLIFQFTSASVFKNQQKPFAEDAPVLRSWMMSAIPSTELAVSSSSTSLSRNQVMEGEEIEFTSTMFNVSTTAAESVTVQLKSTTAGIEQILQQQRFRTIGANDSISFSFLYNTRRKKGNHAFIFQIDPSDSIVEQSKNNNSVTIPYVVQPDTLRPTLQIIFDGAQIVNGDFVPNHPEIRIRFSDNNPANLFPSDTSNFKITLNNVRVPFMNGTAELLNSNVAGKAEIRWTPELAAGENIIEISAKDVSENYSDTVQIFVNVANEFKIQDIFNLPNPFNSFTHFTFNLAGPANPDEVIIKIYTVAGRLIQEISTTGIIGFNKIPWDGRDKDGDQIGNGVYLYKVIVKQGGKQVEGLSKLVKMH